MSGFDVAGVVLGVIPLIISALEDYKAGKGVATALVKWRGLLDTLIFRLKLQKTLFYLQVMELLRDAGVSGLADAVDISEEDCVKALRDAQTGEEVEEYLGYLYPTFLEIIERYENCLKAIASKLGHIVRPPNAKKDDLLAILEAKSLPDSGLAIKARLTFTIERTSLKELVEEMREERLSLKAVIKGMKTQQSYVSSEELSSDSRKLVKTFQQIRREAKSLYEAVRSVCDCECPDKHALMIYLDNRIPTQMTKPKKLKKQKSPTSFNVFFRMDGATWQEMIVNASEDDAAEKQDQKQLGKATYSPDSKAPTVTFTLTSGTDSSEIHEKITSICQSIRRAREKNQLLTLRLAEGHLKREKGSGRIPSAYEYCTTLATFLHQTMHDEDSRMTPRQQTLLALDIAASILQLRDTPWCVKPWDKKSINFLAQSMGTYNSTIAKAHIENSIESQPGSGSVVPSTELDTKAVLLEIAILLLEIWHHRPLETWMAKAGLSLVLDTTETRRIAAIKWVETSSERLPLHHLNAIEGCLAMCSGRIWKWEDDSFQNQYCENVIKPLRESCKAW